jgi:hypothetical protein
MPANAVFVVSFAAHEMNSIKVHCLARICVGIEGERIFISEITYPSDIF